MWFSWQFWLVSATKNRADGRMWCLYDHWKFRLYHTIKIHVFNYHSVKKNRGKENNGASCHVCHVSAHYDVLNYSRVKLKLHTFFEWHRWRKVISDMSRCSWQLDAELYSGSRFYFVSPAGGEEPNRGDLGETWTVLNRTRCYWLKLLKSNCVVWRYIYFFLNITIQHIPDNMRFVLNCTYCISK